ncbi:hypothetical protein HD806DRAFT_533202 [Xylariaceae sp. AK1471]|nr:hypothetical protein HD806DRAFT_533202 [Xylariaceae sp. AK1471]
MSLYVSETPHGAERSRWLALTRLDGFEFPADPQFAGDNLKSFSKVLIGNASLKHLTPRALAVQVRIIFEAACRVYESEDNPVLNGVFYASVAKITNKKDHGILRQVIYTYVDGFKRVAVRSDNRVSVGLQVAPAALSVASWIQLTEGINISVIMTNPTLPRSRKRHAEDPDDHRDDKGAVALNIQLRDTITERDRARHELEDVKIQDQELRRELEAMKQSYGGPTVQFRIAEEEIKQKTTELEHATSKQEKYLKAIKTVQREQQDMVTNLKRRYDDLLAKADAECKGTSRDLVLAKQERDQSQKALADCAVVIKFLNSSLNGEGSDDA